MLSKLTNLLHQVISLLKFDKKHLPVFSFLLALSTLFWILTVMSKEYTTTVRYDVKFVDVPADKLLLDERKVSLHLQVIAPGFTILAHRFRFKKELPISVSTFIPKRKGDYWNYFLLGEQSLSQLQEHLPSNMQLLHVQPNRIDVLLDEKSERLVPVRLKSELSFKDLFRLKEKILLEPSTITISGPKAVVDVFDEINTKLLKLENIESDITGEIDIEPLNHSEINYSKQTVSFQIKVEQFTEGKLLLPVQVTNVPKNFDVKFFPQEVSVSFLVSLDKFELVTPQMFELSVELDLNNRRQTVKLTKQADFVENVRIYPQKIEYFLIKK